MTWAALGSLAFSAMVAVGAFAYAAWASRRMDSIRGELQSATIIAESGRGEVEKLAKMLLDVNVALAESRRAHRAEVAVLFSDLRDARERLAAAQTPEGIVEGLTRRPVKP